MTGEQAAELLSEIKRLNDILLWMAHQQQKSKGRHLHEKIRVFQRPVLRRFPESTHLCYPKVTQAAR